MTAYPLAPSIAITAAEHSPIGPRLMPLIMRRPSG